MMLTNVPSLSLRFLSLGSALGLCLGISMFFTPLSAAQESLGPIAPPAPVSAPVAAPAAASAFDLRHKSCLNRVSSDPEAAYEQGLTWQNQGGGFRAQHCIAMALFGLGRTELAAHRLERIGRSPYGVNEAQRADYYFEAVGFWILAEDYIKARAAANAGLELRPEHLELLMGRARAAANLKDYKAAEKDLDRALSLAPHRAEAYRYRADLHLKQENNSAALRDIEKSLSLNDNNVETALLRGNIREAIRKAEARAIETKLDVKGPVRPAGDNSNLSLPPFAGERPPIGPPQK